MANIILAMKYFTNKNNKMSKLKEADIINIRRLYKENNIKMIDIAKIYGIARRYICSIIRGMRWGWVTSEPPVDISIRYIRQKRLK